MILFRLLGFFLRVVGSFFFVFFLQIQFNGKTLETYLSQFGEKFIVTRTLKKVSQDGAKVIKHLSSPIPEKNKSKQRQLAGRPVMEGIKEFTNRITLPETFQRQDKEDSDSK